MSVYQGERPMARDNRLLGQFNLEGIPPAPRGTPQIEVKFDIDANGILNVSAKELGSNKEQTVRIEQSSGLTETEIERMRKDAESHAEDDKRKYRLAEARNKAEALCFQTEKLVKENESKLSAADKAPLEAAITKAREAAKGEDVDAINSAHDSLEQAAHALSKVLYAANAGGGGPEAATAGAAAKGADDAIEVLCRVYGRQGLGIVPAIRCAGPLESLENAFAPGAPAPVGLVCLGRDGRPPRGDALRRSEEHTSELQSH